MSGGDSKDQNANNSTMAYSESHGWVTYPSLPVGKSMHCHVTVGSSVYVIAGNHCDSQRCDTSNTVFSLSDKQKEWKKEKNLPVSTYDHACAVMGSKIYVMGGYGEEDTLSSVYILDTSIRGSSWQSGPQLPEGRAGALAFVYDNIMYLLAGHKRSVLTLGPDSKSWTEVARVDAYEKYVSPVPILGKNSLHCS